MKKSAGERGSDVQLHWFHSKSASDLGSVKLVSSAPSPATVVLTSLPCLSCFLLQPLNYIFFSSWSHNDFFDSSQQKALPSLQAHIIYSRCGLRKHHKLLYLSCIKYAFSNSRVSDTWAQGLCLHLDLPRAPTKVLGTAGREGKGNGRVS